MKRVVLTWLGLLCAISAASAQTTATGSIRGYVRDSTGAVLPGVTVTASSPTAPPDRVTTTDGQGYYRLVELPPGDYSVTFELQGFNKVVREALAVRATMLQICPMSGVKHHRFSRSFLTC